MLTVCNYHYIRESYFSEYPSIFGVTPNGFKNQLKLLKKTGCFITPSQLVEDYDAVVSSKYNYFCITFDDGLKEQFEFALPILQELDIQAFFFANSINTEMQKVCTVHKIHLLRSILSPEKLMYLLKKKSTFSLNEVEIKNGEGHYRYDTPESAQLKYLLNFKIPFDIQEQIIDIVFNSYFDEEVVLNKLYMSKEELIYLGKNNNLGSHTHTHYPLGLLEIDKLRYELEHSKMYFEALVGNVITAVAYPYGTDEACTGLVAETAKKVGYLYGFTTKRGIIDRSNNKLLLNRFDCNDLIGGKSYSK
ncbi:polysaccharide deacetylase family protein [Flavobacterium sp. K5-23]|uniref:polysaccharide deacetylase family protein n=1 Tax=Flavobacterium sp. K5-23 TaxID=2746225 RepID=UPI00201041C4|nr:polysaccharide deacetylase family protein [Flavobacterium sp. K5-23]UQD56163.1 polysaccharide deacetylase family protein [Flavobacterium sp. K5-23]